MTSLDRLSDVKKSTSQVVPLQTSNTADILAVAFSAELACSVGFDRQEEITASRGGPQQRIY
jgi:hypothetical protein